MKLKVLFVILLISSILCIYSLYHLITWNIDNNKTKEIVKKINMISKEEIKEDNTINIDFNNLLLENNEVVGWIKINGTNINYPVVKHKDNDFYLTHSFDKNTNEAGWIFMDYRNNHNNLDFNTIIYGHGRKDGSMFGSLFQTLNQEWIKNKEHLIINFITLNHNYLFQIFSIYNIKTTDDYININYDEELVNKIKNRSIYQLDTDIIENDKILTLSTCYNNEKKIVVHAKMIYSN